MLNGAVVSVPDDPSLTRMVGLQWVDEELSVVSVAVPMWQLGAKPGGAWSRAFSITQLAIGMLI